MTLPAGTVISYVGSELHSLSGWLLCDGSAQSPSAYPALAQALGGAFGTDASGNFYLPDLRGVFLRGVDGGAAVRASNSACSAATEGGRKGFHVRCFHGPWRSRRRSCGWTGRSAPGRARDSRW